MSAAQRRTAQSAAHAESQRERILDAAQKCFIEHGFHAASMATIAETAAMSTGLIYRYFESKNAIVLAIIARELDGKRAKIEELHAGADFVAKVLGTFRHWQTGDPQAMNAALFLEMSAEAAREPEIARAIHCSDKLTREDFERWLGRSREDGGLGLPKVVARSRAILMQCVIEGLAVRAVRDPELDLETLRIALEPLFLHLKLMPPVPGAGPRTGEAPALNTINPRPSSRPRPGR